MAGDLCDKEEDIGVQLDMLKSSTDDKPQLNLSTEMDNYSQMQPPSQQLQVGNQSSTDMPDEALMDAVANAEIVVETSLNKKRLKNKKLKKRQKTTQKREKTQMSQLVQASQADVEDVSHKLGTLQWPED